MQLSSLPTGGALAPNNREQDNEHGEQEGHDHHGPGFRSWEPAHSWSYEHPKLPEQSRTCWDERFSPSGAEFGQQPTVHAVSILLQPDPAEKAEPESNPTTHVLACVYNMKALVGPAAAAA